MPNVNSDEERAYTSMPYLFHILLSQNIKYNSRFTEEMPFRQNLSKSLTVFKCTRNPIKVARGLSRFRQDGFYEVDLEFKDGTKFSGVPVGAAWMLISYYYWSHGKACYSQSDLEVLHSLGQEIYSNLKKQCGHWVKEMWGLQGTHGIVFMLVRKLKPNLIIETGIAHGYSARIILEALKMNGKGKLVSMDISESLTLCEKTLTQGWLVPQEIRESWTPIVGDSRKVLESISEHPDIFIHDSAHNEEYMMSEYNWASRMLLPGGYLVSDDIDRSEAWVKFHHQNPGYERYVETYTTGVSIKNRQ